MFKYKEKKTLECFICSLRHPCKGGGSPSEQGQKTYERHLFLTMGILKFFGAKIRSEN